LTVKAADKMHESRLVADVTRFFCGKA